MAGTSADGELTILCVGADNRPAEHVNHLYAMAARNAWQPIRFLCFRTDPIGIRPEIECLSLPDIPLSSETQGDWSLLGAFAPSIAKQLSDRVLVLSPDVLIVGSLKPFFERPGDFIMIRDWYHPLAEIGNASVLRFKPSRLTDALDQYQRDHAAITARFRNAREYLSWYAGQFGTLTFWPKGWCVSFRRDCIPPWPLNLWREPRIPVGSRIVVCHGEPTLPRALEGGPTTRGTRAHLPAPWIGEQWRE